MYTFYVFMHQFKILTRATGECSPGEQFISMHEISVLILYNIINEVK